MTCLKPHWGGHLIVKLMLFLSFLWTEHEGMVSYHLVEGRRVGLWGE